MKKLRKVASNKRALPDGQIQTLSVVEICDGQVTALYPLTQEQPFTEWVGGCLSLRRDEQGLLRCYYQDRIIE